MPRVSDYGTTVPLATLVRAVVQHADEVPCTGPYSSWWTDPDTPSEVNQARLLCRSCPALDVCREATEADPPRSVVQAGVWWSPQHQPMTRARVSRSG